MCVCAGSTGAAMVPVANKVRAAIKPRPAVHRPVAGSVAAAQAPTPCLPFDEAVTSAGLAGEQPPAFSTLSPAASDFAAQGSPYTSLGGGGFDTGPGLLGAIGGGGSDVGGGIPALPITNAVPEPATWAMMIAGVGIVGGAMRWRRFALA